MKLVDYLKLLRRRIVLVAVVVALTCAGSIMFSGGGGATYAADTRIRLRPLSPDSRLIALISEVGTRAGASSVVTEGEILRSAAVAEAVAAKIGGDPELLLDQVVVEAILLSEVMVVTASAGSPERATAVADGFAEEYIAVRRDQAADAAAEALVRINGRIDTTEARLEQLEQRLLGLQPLSAAFEVTSTERDRVLDSYLLLQSDRDVLSDVGVLQAGGGDILEPARATVASSAGSAPGAAVLGILVGIPLALAVALVLDSLKDGAGADEDQVAELTGATVMAVVPKDPRLAGHHRLAEVLDPSSPAAEAYRILRDNLTRALRSAGAHSVLVTSAGDAEGRSTTVAQLALALADSRQPTVVVDADLRSPSMHARLGAARSPGLTDLPAPALACRFLQPVRPDLELLAAGAPTSRPDLVLSPAVVHDLLHALVAPDNPGTALTLVDAPPILRAAEVSTLAAAVDAVILVVRAGASPEAEIRRAADQVRKAGGFLLGAVLVGATPAERSGPSTRSRGTAERATVAPVSPPARTAPEPS